MTRSQRRAVSQEGRDKSKKTGLKCEECNGEVIRSGINFICSKCGLTQDRTKLSRWKSTVYFDKTKCNQCGRALFTEHEKSLQMCKYCQEYEERKK